MSKSKQSRITKRLKNYNLTKKQKIAYRKYYKNHKIYV